MSKNKRQPSMAFWTLVIVGLCNLFVNLLKND
jgi:hypothetical protein